MTEQNRTRYSAKYLYPGAFFPEEIWRDLDEPTLSAAIASAPAETDGYFTRDGWYAVNIQQVVSKRFVADDGEVTWVNLGRPTSVLNVIVGDRVHYSEIEDAERNQILISNIKGNSRDGYGVRTRAGNWQIASDYDQVISAAEAATR